MVIHRFSPTRSSGPGGLTPAASPTPEPEAPPSPPYPINDDNLFSSTKLKRKPPPRTNTSTSTGSLSTPPSTPPLVQSESEEPAPAATSLSVITRFPHLVPSPATPEPYPITEAPLVQERPPEPRKPRRKPVPKPEESPSTSTTARKPKVRTIRTPMPQDRQVESDPKKVRRMKVVSKDKNGKARTKPKATTEPVEGSSSSRTTRKPKGNSRSAGQDPSRTLKHSHTTSELDQLRDPNLAYLKSRNTGPETEDNVPAEPNIQHLRSRAPEALSTRSESFPSDTRNMRRRISIDSIPSIPPPMDEYKNDDETPPYRERLHKKTDLISFDPRYSIPVLRVNRRLIKNETFLKLSIKRMTKLNLLPSEVNLWGLNHVDDSHFHEILPLLLSDRNISTAIERIEELGQQLSNRTPRAEFIPHPAEGLTEEDQINYALRLSALEAQTRVSDGGFRYNAAPEESPEVPAESSNSVQVPVLDPVQSTENLHENAEDTPEPEQQPQPEITVVEQPRIRESVTEPVPAVPSVRNNPPTISAQFFRSLNNNPIFNGLRYAAPQADTQSIYSQSSLSQVDPV